MTYQLYICISSSISSLKVSLHRIPCRILAQFAVCEMFAIECHVTSVKFSLNSANYGTWDLSVEFWIIWHRRESSSHKNSHLKFVFPLPSFTNQTLIFVGKIGSLEKEVIMFQILIRIVKLIWVPVVTRYKGEAIESRVRILLETFIWWWLTRGSIWYW